MMTFRISNNTSAERSFHVEPWGGKYTMKPGASLLVKIESETPPELEWELLEDVSLLIVHGPTGVDATVFDGDQQVIAQ